MDVNNKQKSNNNKPESAPDNFYDIVSKILTFVDDIDKKNNKNLNSKKKGDKK